MSFTLLEKVLAGATAEPLSATSRKVSQVLVQVKRTNSNSMQIAPGTFVSGKGIELLAPATGDPLPSFPIVPTGNQNNLDLKDWYLLGTTGEGANLIIEEF